MKRYLITAALATVLAGPGVHAAVDATLPAGVISQLGSAQTPAQIAALVLANPGALAATIIAQANRLGVATPSEIVAAAETTSVSEIVALVQAAVESSPAQSETIVRAGFLLLGGNAANAPALAAAGIAGLKNAGVSGAVQAREAAEIASVLFALVPEESQQSIAQAIADATDDPTDTAQTVAEAASGIETASAILPFGDRRARPLSRVPSFVTLPGAASPN